MRRGFSPMAILYSNPGVVTIWKNINLFVTKTRVLARLCATVADIRCLSGVDHKIDINIKIQLNFSIT